MYIETDETPINILCAILCLRIRKTKLAVGQNTDHTPSKFCVHETKIKRRK